MKKLLSILTITTLTASVPAPLLATTPLTRVKRDVGSGEKEKTDDEILFLKQSKNILAIFNNDTFVEKLRQDILEIFNLRSYIEKNSSLSTYKIEPVKNDSIF